MHQFLSVNVSLMIEHAVVQRVYIKGYTQNIASRCLQKAHLTMNCTPNISAKSQWHDLVNQFLTLLGKKKILIQLMDLGEWFLGDMR